MEHTRCWLVVLCITIASPSAAQVDRRNTGSATVGGDARGAQRASCVLQVTFDPNRGSRGIDVQTLNAMLTSTTLVDPAAQKALGLAPDAWPKVAQVELVPAGSSAMKLTVTVTQNPNVKVPDNAAQAFMAELTARAKSAVEQASLKQEEAAQARRATLEKDLAVARERLESIQAQLRQARGSTAEGDTDRMTGRNLAAERSTLELNLTTQRAKLSAIESEVARLTASATTRPYTSPWADLVTARERVVEAVRARKQEGRADETDVAEALAKLAEARAQAASATLAQRAGVDPLERWQGEIPAMRIGIAESEARLAAINARMPKPAATTQPVGPADVERLQREEMRARQDVDELTNQLEQIRRERRISGGAAGVQLFILDGSAPPSPPSGLPIPLAR